MSSTQLYNKVQYLLQYLQYSHDMLMTNLLHLLNSRHEFLLSPKCITLFLFLKLHMHILTSSNCHSISIYFSWLLFLHFQVLNDIPQESIYQFISLTNLYIKNIQAHFKVSCRIAFYQSSRKLSSVVGEGKCKQIQISKSTE